MPNDLHLPREPVACHRPTIHMWRNRQQSRQNKKTFRQGRQLSLSQSTKKSSNVCKILGDLVGPPHFQLRKRKQFAANQKLSEVLGPRWKWGWGQLNQPLCMMLMWFRETVFCCFSLLWNKSWEQKDQRTLKLVTLATVLAVSNADQRRGNIVLKRLESYYHLSKGLPNLIGQIFMGSFSKQ